MTTLRLSAFFMTALSFISLESSTAMQSCSDSDSDYREEEAKRPTKRRKIAAQGKKGVKASQRSAALRPPRIEALAAKDVPEDEAAHLLLALSPKKNSGVVVQPNLLVIPRPPVLPSSPPSQQLGPLTMPTPVSYRRPQVAQSTVVNNFYGPTTVHMRNVTTPLDDSGFDALLEALIKKTSSAVSSSSASAAVAPRDFDDASSLSSHGAVGEKPAPAPRSRKIAQPKAPVQPSRVQPPRGSHAIQIPQGAVAEKVPQVSPALAAPQPRRKTQPKAPVQPSRVQPLRGSRAIERPQVLPEEVARVPHRTMGEKTRSRTRGEQKVALDLSMRGLDIEMRQDKGETKRMRHPRSLGKRTRRGDPNAISLMLDNSGNLTVADSGRRLRRK